MTARTQFFSGAKAISPILLGVLPFATISGIVAIDAGLTPAEAIGMAVILFAGAAQLAATQLIGNGAAPPVIVFTALIINLRFVMYSASMAPYLKKVTAWKRALLSYVLTDQAYALSIAKFTQNPDAPHKPWFYAGATAALWVTWQLGSLAGIFLGAQVPAQWSLDFAVPLTFLALLVPVVNSRPAIVAAAVAGITVMFAFNLPFNLGLITASLVGIAAGWLAETFLSRGAQS